MKKYLSHNGVFCLKKALLSIGKGQSGASAIEFAVLAPVLMLFTFGILEFTLAFCTYIRAGEALRSAARIAAIQPAIADLSTLDEIPAVCSSGANISCGTYSVSNPASYNAILAEAQRILSDIDAGQLSVSYSSSGAGFSTTAGGSTPLVTVQLSDYQYELILKNLIPGVSSITFPSFTTSRLISY